MGCAFMTLLKKRRIQSSFWQKKYDSNEGVENYPADWHFSQKEEENYDMTKKMCSNFSKSAIMNLDLPSLSIIFLTDQLSSKQQTAVKTLHLLACPNATLSHFSCPFWLSCLWGPLIRSTIGQHFGEKDFHSSSSKQLLKYQSSSRDPFSRRMGNWRPTDPPFSFLKGVTNSKVLDKYHIGKQ